MVSSVQPPGKALGIFPQILFTIAFVAAIPLFGLWYIGIEKAQAHWSDQIYRNLVHNTDSLTQSVDDWTSMNLLLLQQNAATPDIYAMDSERQLPVLKDMSNTYDWIYLAITFLPDGNNIARSAGKPRKNYSDRTYFQDAIGGKQLGQQLLIGNTSGKPSSILAKPIIADDGSKKGVIALGMTL